MKEYFYRFSFLISLQINILLCIYLYLGGDEGALQWGEKQEIGLSWSKKAAMEAEAIAAISCSGHGRAYLDGLTSEGQPVCECYDCYGGIDCSQFSPGCPADAHSGDPIFLEPFWMQNAANSAVMISGWHRMGYQYADSTMMSKELENYIHKLHSLVGNAKTKGRYLVFGVGSAQLLTAAVYALSSLNSSSTSHVLASIPYYSFYRDQTLLFQSENFQFKGDTNLWKMNNLTKSKDLIEFVTSPNNPDGELKKAVLGGKAIYDHAYLWPHYTPIPSPSDEDLMIFTLSKLTGHAGTRFGWAVIKDKDVYKRVLKNIILADLGISKDTQLRVIKLLKVAMEGDGKPFFEFSYNKMRERWERLTCVFSKSTRFSIQQRHPLHCNFFNQTRPPSPAYAWVKCEREEEDNCGKVLKQGKIIGRLGSKFGAEDRFHRLSLIKSQDDFELLLQRLTELVSLENSSVLDCVN